MFRGIKIWLGKNPFLRRSGGRERKEYAKKYADKVMKSLNSGARKMGKEAKETQEMAQSFFKLLEHKLKLKERSEPPTEQEVKEAIEQLKDVGRVSFFATLSILPGGAFSLIGLEILAAKFGVKNFTLIPSSFRKNADWHYPGSRSEPSEDIETEIETNPGIEERDK